MGQRQSCVSANIAPYQCERLVKQLMKTPPDVRGQLTPIVPQSDQSMNTTCTGTIMTPITPVAR